MASQGIEKIIEIGLTEEEKQAFKESARQIREGIRRRSDRNLQELKDRDGSTPAHQRLHLQPFFRHLLTGG